MSSFRVERGSFPPSTAGRAATWDFGPMASPALHTNHNPTNMAGCLHLNSKTRSKDRQDGISRSFSELSIHSPPLPVHASNLPSLPPPPPISDSSLFIRPPPPGPQDLGKRKLPPPAAPPSGPSGGIGESGEGPSKRRRTGNARWKRGKMNGEESLLPVDSLSFLEHMDEPAEVRDEKRQAAIRMAEELGRRRKEVGRLKAKGLLKLPVEGDEGEGERLFPLPEYDRERRRTGNDIVIQSFGEAVMRLGTAADDRYLRTAIVVDTTMNIFTAHLQKTNPTLNVLDSDARHMPAFKLERAARCMMRDLHEELGPTRASEIYEGFILYIFDEIRELLADRIFHHASTVSPSLSNNVQLNRSNYYSIPSQYFTNSEREERLKFSTARSSGQMVPFNEILKPPLNPIAFADAFEGKTVEDGKVLFEDPYNSELEGLKERVVAFDKKFRNQFGSATPAPTSPTPHRKSLPAPLDNGSTFSLSNFHIPPLYPEPDFQFPFQFPTPFSDHDVVPRRPSLPSLKLPSLRLSGPLPGGLDYEDALVMTPSTENGSHRKSPVLGLTTVQKEREREARRRRRRKEGERVRMKIEDDVRLRRLGLGTERSEAGIGGDEDMYA
ncbi:hypothetical protein BT69DRAFT_1355788 [Atractiella rhizophila]|nr:hypothetical protein BT69DRAFT_1355788 [Atractiella rhizophila]